MARLNFRDTYPFDPYDAENAGGLLGMLQAIVQQGQAGMAAGLDPRASGNEISGLPQAADYGHAPPTRITVRPPDPYSRPEETQGGDGDLLGRLLALQAEQSRYQPSLGNDAHWQPTPNPNFRQLSRMPVEAPQEGSNRTLDKSDNQLMQPHSPLEGSNAGDLSWVPQSDKTAQLDRSLSDRIQSSWDHPHPYGLISMLKGALDGMKVAVQSAYDATSEPSTEEEAFRQNLGREMGPIGAWDAVSSLPSGRTTKFFARPFTKVPRIGPQPVPLDRRMTTQGTDGPIAKTNASVDGRPLGAYETRNWPKLQGGDLGPATAHRPLPPIPEPALPDWMEVEWKRPGRDKSGGDGGGGGGAGGGGGRGGAGGDGGGDGRDDCAEEIRSARERCQKAKDNNWKSEVAVGPFKKKSKGRWTVEDCMRGFVSERCLGNLVEKKQPQANQPNKKQPNSSKKSTNRPKR